MATITREALYDLVWTEPVRTVATTFGVSDVWLKKVCAGANVPVPQRGYWAKLKAGKPAIKVKLPPREPGAPQTFSISKVTHDWRWDPAAELALPLPDPPVFDETIAEVRARVEKRVGKVAYARSLDAPWGAIRKLLEEDERRRAKQAAETWSSDWWAPYFDSPFERRRLRVLNSLAHGFAKAGAKLELRGKVARELNVVVGSQRLGFKLDHPAAKPTIHGEWKTRPGPIDTLRLEMDAKFPDAGIDGVWTDGADGKLEERLTEIVVSFIVAGEAQYRARQADHHAWLIKRRADNEAELERRRIEAERKRREQEEREARERREHLLAQASDWRTAQDIRGFVASVLAEPSAGSDSRIAAWQSWALAEADAIDPVRRGLEVLQHLDEPRRPGNERCDSGTNCYSERNCEA